MGAVLSHPSHFSPGGVTWSSSLKKSLEGHVPALPASCRALCSAHWTAPDLWHTALPVLTPRAAHFCAWPAAWPPRHIRLHGDLHSPGLTAALAGQSSAWSTHEGVGVACVQSHGRPGRTGASSAAQAPDLTRLSCSASPGHAWGPSPGWGCVWLHPQSHRGSRWFAETRASPLANNVLLFPCEPPAVHRPTGPRSVCLQAAGAVGGPGLPRPGCRPLTRHVALPAPSTTTRLSQAHLLPAAHSSPGLQSRAPLDTWSELGPLSLNRFRTWGITPQPPEGSSDVTGNEPDRMTRLRDSGRGPGAGRRLGKCLSGLSLIFCKMGTSATLPASSPSSREPKQPGVSPTQEHAPVSAAPWGQGSRQRTPPDTLTPRHTHI